MRYHFPKCDLHLHLDGSFRIETVWRLAKEQGVILPGKTLEEYRQFLIDCSNAESVNQYLKMFDDPIKVMQDPDSLALVTKELILDLQEIGMAYAEIRFAPQLHTRKGMSQAEAVEAVLKGREEGLKECPGLRIGIITCMMSIGPETLNWEANEETVEVCRKYLGKGVVGIDLAGAEGIVPLSNFAPLFAKAKEYGLPMTCHAGDSQDWKTVEDAIAFGVTRIGHGHHIYENPALCRVAAEKGIALEICPTSNIQCKTRESYPLHPAQNLLNMGIPVTINTDNMTLARVNVEDEYDHCLNEMGFEEEDLILMNINSVKASFMPEEDKKVLIAELMTYLES
ncbi:MAG: adenosine deaminase [Erysipelotrichaceae bacterium]|nr:adenosine deaminase [Erysipelotrichaceae bacterium]